MSLTAFLAGFAGISSGQVHGTNDVAHLSASSEHVRIELDRGTVVAVLQQAVGTSAGFTWSGSLTPPDVGFASFAVADGVVRGTVRDGDRVVRVRGQLGGRIDLAGVDTLALAPCTEPEVARLGTNSPQSDLGASALAAAATIDVLVVWTPLAQAAEGGASAMEALVDLALAETNQAYAQSGVLQRVRLVARQEIAYSESSSVVVDLSRLTIPNDGLLDQVPTLRDACGADVVALVVESSQSCGVANTLTNLGAGFAPYAFCVVARNCASANLSLAHELGHVMGLAHDRDTSTMKCSRASVAGASTQAAGASGQPSISRSGSRVAFASSATNLVAGDTNGLVDVFLRDRGTLATTRVSVTTSGAQGDGPCVGAPSTGDGTFVAFASSATNLVVGDTNGSLDVFVRDVTSATTTRILPAAGLQADGDCFEPSFSPSERYVVFTSRAPNLGASATHTQVFRWDRLTSATELVSANTSAQPALGASGSARVSDDGRYVAFSSSAADLVAGDTNGVIDVFVRDMTLGTTSRASLSVTGSELAGACEAACAISADGRWIAFATASPNVVASDANGVTDLFARDRVNGVTLLASASVLGRAANGPSSVGSAPSFSNDGRRLAFASDASDLVASDTNARPDVFVRDLVAGSTERVSLSSSGAEIAGGSGEGSAVAIDSAGSRVAFASRAACALVDTNGVSDVYVFDRSEPFPPGHSSYAYGYRTPDQAWRTIMAYAPGGRVPFFSNPNVAWQGQALGLASPSPFAAEAWRTLNDTAAIVSAFRAESTSAFCFGDGSGTPCPCGNSSASADRAGCTNSLGSAGRLTATGGASIALDSLVLRADGMPNSSALYFQGSTLQSAGAGSVFGDGLRCAAGSVLRLGVRANVASASMLPSSGGLPLSIAGGIAAPATVHYQVWYRNSAAFCSASTFNLTNGVSVVWRS